MTEKKSVKLADEVLVLSNQMKEVFDIDKNTGVGSAPDDIYKDHLPEGIDMEQVKAISNYNSNFIAAGAHAFGVLAVDAMADNKELKDASLTVPMGHKDAVTYNVNREHTYKNNFAKDPDNATVTKYGTISTCYDVKAGDLSGELKNARELIREIATDKLAKC